MNEQDQPGGRSRMRRVSLLLVLFLFGCAFVGLPGTEGQATDRMPASRSLDRARKGIVTLQRWYDPSTGLYRDSGWWNSANAITVLIDYARLRHTQAYNEVIANTFVAAQNEHPGFINNFYDDEGWWGLAWVDAWDLTHDRTYLAMARSIFEDMAGGWDSTCGGGIWWNKTRHYKNAIANELFLSLAAHLANRDSEHRSEYLTWANREWRWFSGTGMINAENLVNDGLAIDRGAAGKVTCRNNGMTTWSYNQGVVLGGLAELSQADSSPEPVQRAKSIATAAITHLADRNGILHDACEPNCGKDGSQFKGIFLRNLAVLDELSPSPAYIRFIQDSAHAIWKYDRGPGNKFGVVWSGPFTQGNATTQTSALDALIAAAAVARAQVPRGSAHNEFGLRSR